MYYIALTDPTNTPVPCTFVPSIEQGKTLTINESGQSMVVEPDGSQSRWIDPSDPNFDSEWTRGTPLSGFIVYRSTPTGIPRAFRMIV